MKKVIEKINYNAPVTLTFTLIALTILLIDTISGGRVALNWFALRPTFEL